MARQGMRRALALTAIALACGLPGVARGSAVTRTVRASGQASAASGDRVAALAEARRAALRSAVEEGVGVLVSSATQVENFAVIADRILTRTQGYVRSFSVVEETVEDGIARVVIDAVVDLKDLHRDLAGLRLALGQIGNPRVICTGQEVWASGPGDPVARGTVQAELSRTIDLHGAGRFLLALPGQGAGEGADGSAAALLVTGTARLSPQQVAIPFGTSTLAQTGLHSVEARLELGVRWSDTGEPVGSLASQGRAAGTTVEMAAQRAVGQAVAAVGDSLVAMLAEEVRAKAYSPRLVSLQVRAPLDLLVAFEEEVPLRLSSVKALERRSYAAGLGTYDLRTTAAGFDLAWALSATGLDAAAVEVISASANALCLALAPPAGDQTP